MADITYWCLEQDTLKPKPTVRGKIHVEGQFTWDEWIKLREMFMRMRSQPLPRLLSTEEIVTRVMAGEHPESVAQEAASLLRESTAEASRK